MSYGTVPNPRARKNGGGMIFFIILAIGAFLLFNNRGGPGNNPTNVPDRGSYDPDDILGGGRRPV